MTDTPKTIPVKAGRILFCGPGIDDYCIGEAKKYVRQNNYTPKQVRIVLDHKQDLVRVETITDFKHTPPAATQGMSNIEPAGGRG